MKRGIAILLGLFVVSFSLSHFFPAALANHCPLGADPLHPDRTICELAVGGLWVSLWVALCAALFATGLGLLVAMAARALGGWGERAVIHTAESFFALPDVLVLLVLQFAGQTMGDLNPAWRVSSITLMVVSLALIGWAAPARILHNRIVSLERQDYVTAARALGATRTHIFRFHLWPGLKDAVLTVLISRIPAAILAESTVSFLGVARLEPFSLGRYLGGSISAVLHPGGWRIVGPAWALLVVVVFAASLAGRASSTAAATAR